MLPGSFPPFPTADDLTEARDRATAAADGAEDLALAQLHQGCAALLTSWIHAAPHIKLGGFYPGIGAVNEIARSYLGGEPTT